MKGATTIQERLKDLRVERRLKLEDVAAATGISKSALGNYENNDYKEINHGNLIILAKFYDVSIDYLLCLTENRKHANTELSELHLSDEMIGLLKSGNIITACSAKLPRMKNLRHSWRIPKSMWTGSPPCVSRT